MDLFIVIFVIFCNLLYESNQTIKEDVVMLMSRVKIKRIISKKNIYNTLTTRDGDGEVAVSLPNLSVLVDVTAQCSFMNPSQRLLVVAAGGQMCGRGPQKEAGGGFPSDKRGVLVCWLYKSVCVTAPLKINPDMQPLNCG